MKIHLSKFLGRCLFTWCGRGVCKPLPAHLLVVSDKRKATCEMCLLAYNNNQKVKP